MSIPSSPTDTYLIRLIFPAICIGVAFSTARFIQKPSEKTTPANISAPTPDTILSRLPLPDTATPTGKLLAAALQKTRTSTNDPKNWILIGDAFAQLQRETEAPRFHHAAEAAYMEALRRAPKSSAALAGMAWVTGGRHHPPLTGSGIEELPPPAPRRPHRRREGTSETPARRNA